MLLRNGQYLALERRTRRAGFLEARRDDDDRADPAEAAIVDDCGDVLGWNDDDGQIDRRRDVFD